MNPTSARSRNRNLLNQRTKSFKQAIKDSEKRAKSHSSIHTLAGKLYSKSSNKNFNPETMRNSKVSNMSSSRSSKINRSSLSNNKNNSQVMNGLSLRVEHVSTFAELNTELLHEKKQLQTMILMLKQGIAKQKKKLNTAEYNCSHHTNQIANFASQYEQAHRKSIRLNEQIKNVNDEIQELQKSLNSLEKKINKKKEKIQREKKNVKSLQRHTKNLKKSVMEEEKLRVHFKSELIKQQKVMQSASIYLKELQNEKAMLLLQINASVCLNKL